MVVCAVQYTLDLDTGGDGGSGVELPILECLCKNHLPEYSPLLY